MELIRETINTVIGELERKTKNAKRSDPQELLKKILSQRELKHLRAGNLKNGVLNINVDSSGWLYQLSLNKEALVDKLHKKCAQIKDVRFYLGQVK